MSTTSLSVAIRNIRRGLTKAEPYDSLYSQYKDLLLTRLNAPNILNEDTKKHIWYYFITTRDRTIFSYVNGLTDEQFDFSRFTQYKEYRKINPSDSGSDTFYALKYGSNWKEIKDGKTRRNPYALETYLSDGMDVETAHKMVIEAKKKTAPSIEKMGEEKFKKSCRRHKNYIDYWLKKTSGNEEEAKRLMEKYTTETNRYHVNFYLKRGLTEEEAKQTISNLQTTSAGVHRTYYEILGYDDETINAIMAEIYRKKDSASMHYIKQKYKIDNSTMLSDLYLEHNNSKSKTYRKEGFRSKDHPNYTMKQKYYAEVYQVTKMWICYLPPCPGIPGRSEHPDRYHIDHIYSIAMGFENNVSPKIIGHISNLRWLNSIENCSKGAKSAIELNELLERYENYENQKN